MAWIQRWSVVTVAAAAMWLGAGCDDDDGDDAGGAGGEIGGAGGHGAHGGEGGHAAHGGAGGEAGFDEVAVACDHLEGGPFTDVTFDGDTTPDVTPPHTHYRITLAADEDGSYGGVMHFHPEAESHYIFMLNADVPLEITDGAGVVLHPTETMEAPAQCPEATRALMYSVPAAMHMIRIGPSAVESVGLVIHQPSAAHGEGGSGGEHDHG